MYIMFLISPKTWRVRYRKVIFRGNDHAVPNNCVRYNKCPLSKCLLYRGFSMSVCL